MLSNTKQSGSVYLSELNCCLQWYRKEISHLPCSLSSPLSSPIPFQLPKFIKPHLLIKPPALQMECYGWNFFFTHSLLTLRFQALAPLFSKPFPSPQKCLQKLYLGRRRRYTFTSLARFFKRETQGAFHLVKISGISGSAVNGTRFVGSSHWKIPRKSGKSKKVVPFSRLEFLNGMSCSIYVSRSLYQFQVHGRLPRRTGV